MTRLRKAIKEAEKAARYAFRHGTCKAKPKDVTDYYALRLEFYNRDVKQRFRNKFPRGVL